MYTDALRCLADKGLTAAIAIAGFHRRRVLPLMDRRLHLFQMMEDAPSEGTRTMEELLSHEIATQRAMRRCPCLQAASETSGGSRCAPTRGMYK